MRKMFWLNLFVAALSLNLASVAVADEDATPAEVVESTDGEDSSFEADVDVADTDEVQDNAE